MHTRRQSFVLSLIAVMIATGGVLWFLYAALEPFRTEIGVLAVLVLLAFAGVGLRGLIIEQNKRITHFDFHSEAPVDGTLVPPGFTLGRYPQPHSYYNSGTQEEGYQRQR